MASADEAVDNGVKQLVVASDYQVIYVLYRGRTLHVLYGASAICAVLALIRSLTSLQSKAKKKMCCLLVIVVIVLAVLGIILAVELKK